MDNYPEHLSPEFDDGGGVATPFDEWWPRVRGSFPYVPEDVARQWLHRHWGHSPFEWLLSAEYRFQAVTWEAKDLKQVRYRLNDFDGTDELPLHFAKQALEVHQRYGGMWVVERMLDTGTFPVPPIILDNRDRHLVDHVYHNPDYYPAAYVLVEGHRRYEFAPYLANEGRLAPTLNFWLMSHVA